MDAAVLATEPPAVPQVAAEATEASAVRAGSLPAAVRIVPSGDTVEWGHIFANWATDRGHGLTAATFKLLGTPGYVAARAAFRAGASEKVVRSKLDQADTMTINKDAGD